MSAAALRDLAREAMLACGARGFMRFAREGGALLVTDAASRCADGGAALCRALEEAGFICLRQEGLTLLTPGDALLAQLCSREDGAIKIDWTCRLHPAEAFASRLMREADTPMTDAGRAFVLDMARLCWQLEDKVLEGLTPLRAQAARLMREKDRTGFACAGRLLGNWCDERTKEELR